MDNDHANICRHHRSSIICQLYLSPQCRRAKAAYGLTDELRVQRESRQESALDRACNLQDADRNTDENRAQHEHKTAGTMQSSLYPGRTSTFEGQTAKSRKQNRETGKQGNRESTRQKSEIGREIGLPSASRQHRRPEQLCPDLGYGCQSQLDYKYYLNGDKSQLDLMRAANTPHMISLVLGL